MPKEITLSFVECFINKSVILEIIRSKLDNEIFANMENLWGNLEGMLLLKTIMQDCERLGTKESFISINLKINDYLYTYGNLTEKVDIGLCYSENHITQIKNIQRKVNKDIGELLMRHTYSDESLEHFTVYKAGYLVFVWDDVFPLVECIESIANKL